MGALDWLLLGLVAAGVFFAVRAYRHGHSGCCGDCAHCRGAACGKDPKEE